MSEPQQLLDILKHPRKDMVLLMVTEVLPDQSLATRERWITMSDLFQKAEML